MPLIKSAIKRAKQSEARRIRRQPFKTQLKTSIRKFTDLVAEGKAAEAEKMLPRVFSTIDTAKKKHILHRNTADRKKASLSKMVSKKK
jgi:small subunit ribosomal protein S20